MKKTPAINGTTLPLLSAVLLTTLLFASVAAWPQTDRRAERITNGPVVKNTTGTGTEIAWSTVAQGSSIVNYGPRPNELHRTAEAPWGGTKESNGDYNHSVWLKGLKPHTTYYFVVQTTQGAVTDTQAESQVQEFHTK